MKCLFRHNLDIIKKIGDFTYELKCNKCGKEFVYNDYLKIMHPLDETFKSQLDSFQKEYEDIKEKLRINGDKERTN